MQVITHSVVVIIHLLQRPTSDEPDATKYIDDRYRGVYCAGTPYIKGEFVTHRGSLWHCCKDYDGDSFSYDAFTLCVKGEKK